MAKTPDFLDEEQFQVRTAWLYHVERMTQGAIAEHMGVTRLRVNRALRDAMRNGIVKVSIHSEYAPSLELEEIFREKFNLRHVAIAPSPADDANAIKVVGAELGRYLSVLLRDSAIKLFGIAWGATLNFATRAVMPARRPDLEIVSVMGGLPRGSDINTFDITTRLSETFSAERTYLTVPLYASTTESRDTILVQEVFQEVFEKIRRADGMVTGVGDMSEKSLLIRDGLPGDVNRDELIEAGAVGDIMGYFIDAEGQMIDHPITRRVLGLHPFEFRGMRNLILAAGGRYKRKVILAALRTGIYEVLVTDQAAAESILRLAGYDTKG
ncbi:MAG: sugar-binding transcriptional regulator [Rhodospirillales bacterium]|nr:sugar-binding transcriptional regulator [Rhodospirillales bacterium]